MLVNVKISPHLKWTIGHLQNTIILFVCPLKFCISIILTLTLTLTKSQKKIKTMLMQSFGGQTKSIMVFLKVAYCKSRGKWKYGTCIALWNQTGRLLSQVSVVFICSFISHFFMPNAISFCNLNDTIWQISRLNFWWQNNPNF